MSTTAKGKGPIRLGSLRPSALLHTFGVGAVVDLPRMTVMVMGLDEWRLDDAPMIDEPRLVAQLQGEPGLEKLVRLHGPPQSEDLGGLSYEALAAARVVGVPVAPFPRWLVCPVCHRLAPVESGLFQLKADSFRPDRSAYVHHNCQRVRGAPPKVLPARFVVACEDGHLDDFPWAAFVHRTGTDKAIDCPGPNLLLEEFGVSGEVAEIQVRCAAHGETTVARRLSEAFGEENRESMPTCRGTHPHLRQREDCERRMRPMLLGASNSWFAVTRSALSVPRHVDPLLERVAAGWTTLQHVTGPEVLTAFRALGNLSDFEGVPDAALLAAIQTERAGVADQEETSESLRLPEWRLLMDDAPPQSPDFTARAVAVPAGYEGVIERVVLAERVREVRALVGFTRIESPYGEDAEQGWTRLARTPPAWLPAIEVHGEGVFIALREEAVETWVAANRDREEEFFRAHVAWGTRRDKEDPSAGFPGLRFVLVHSLAHALMRRMALECGYSHASIRERVYALPPEHPEGPMAGMLLYTAAPGSEGTLGGLVALGEPGELGRHLAGALRDAALCASDPLCAEHDPDRLGFTLHGAACHACMFSPETSCERGNRYLDRAVLGSLVTGTAIGFMPAHELA